MFQPKTRRFSEAYRIGWLVGLAGWQSFSGQKVSECQEPEQTLALLEIYSLDWLAGLAGWGGFCMLVRSLAGAYQLRAETLTQLEIYRHGWCSPESKPALRDPTLDMVDR